MMLAKVRKMDTEGLKSKSPKYPYISGLEDAMICGYIAVFGRHSLIINLEVAVFGVRLQL